MKITSSSLLAAFSSPIRQRSRKRSCRQGAKHLFGSALALASLSSLAVPMSVRADVNITYAQVYGETAAWADDGIGTPGPNTVAEDLHQTVGDFSASVRAYQEAINIFPFGPDLAASAEARVDYTAHFSAQKFSATFDEMGFVDVNLTGAAGRAFNAFYYLVEFTVTEAIAFHYVTTYAQGGNSFSHRLDFFNHDGKTVLQTPPVYYESLNVTGLLLPGDYTFGYRAQRFVNYDDLGSVRGAPGPASILLTFGDDNTHAPGVPDTGTTLSLLAFSLVGLLASKKLAARAIG